MFDTYQFLVKIIEEKLATDKFDSEANYKSIFEFCSK